MWPVTNLTQKVKKISFKSHAFDAAYVRPRGLEAFSLSFCRFGPLGTTLSPLKA